MYQTIQNAVDIKKTPGILESTTRIAEGNLDERVAQETQRRNKARETKRPMVDARMRGCNKLGCAMVNNDAGVKS